MEKEAEEMSSSVSNESVFNCKKHKNEGKCESKIRTKKKRGGIIMKLKTARVKGSGKAFKIKKEYVCFFLWIYSLRFWHNRSLPHQSVESSGALWELKE